MTIRLTILTTGLMCAVLSLCSGNVTAQQPAAGGRRIYANREMPLLSPIAPIALGYSVLSSRER